MSFKVLIILFGITYFLPSCRNYKNEHPNCMLALSNQLDSSNKLIREKSAYFQNHLESKSYDVSMAEHGNIWLPKARSIKRLTNTTYEKIELYKIALSRGRGIEKDDSLFQNLLQYIQQIKALSPYISNVFDSVCMNQFRILNYNLLERNQFHSVFSESNTLELNMGFLTILQNKLSLIENLLSEFCDNQVGTTGFTIYQPIPFVNQNLQQLKRGEELVINAGLCYYNFPSNSKMYIDGNEIKREVNGRYTYRFNVSDKIGKYRIPLKFEYFDHLSKKKTVVSFVDYSIE